MPALAIQLEYVTCANVHMTEVDLASLLWNVDQDEGLTVK